MRQILCDEQCLVHVVNMKFFYNSYDFCCFQNILKSEYNVDNGVTNE